MSSSDRALAVDGVHVWRGDRHVLRGVSLRLAAGEALTIRGPNGAGKTTLLRVMTGLLRPEQGEVHWCGVPILADRGAYQSALAFASHEPALKGDLTALENLRFSVGLKRIAPDDELRDGLERVGAGRCADLPVRVLSAGQKRRVAMARVIAMRAPLWLLDEPFTNLDAHGSERMVALLDEHVAAGGMAVIVAHQDLTLAHGVRRLDLAA